jgi:hypothetical protein
MGTIVLTAGQGANCLDSEEASGTILDTNVPIAQWIERCPPEAEAQVRVLVGTHQTAQPRGFFCCVSSYN